VALGIFAEFTAFERDQNRAAVSFVSCQTGLELKNQSSEYSS
jgi:hypothetical protein